MSLKAVDAISVELMKGLCSKNMTVRQLSIAASISFDVVSGVVGASHYAALSSSQYEMIASILGLYAEKLIKLGVDIEKGLDEIPF